MKTLLGILLVFGVALEASAYIDECAPTLADWPSNEWSPAEPVVAEVTVLAPAGTDWCIATPPATEVCRLGGHVIYRSGFDECYDDDCTVEAHRFVCYPPDFPVTVLKHIECRC